MNLSDRAKILYDECLFPVEIIDLINMYSPESVSKCAAVVCKYAFGKVLVGRKYVCIVDFANDYCIVYSGKTFKPIKFIDLKFNSTPIAMDGNDNLIVVANSCIRIYNTHPLNNLSTEIQNELIRFNQIYDELKVIDMKSTIVDGEEDNKSDFITDKEREWFATKETLGDNLLKIKNMDDSLIATHLWNIENIPCDVCELSARYSTDNKIALIQNNSPATINFVDLVRKDTYIYKNNAVILDVLFPFRWPNYCIILHPGFLVIQGRKYYSRLNTQVCIPEYCNKLLESPNGRKILVHQDLGGGIEYTRRLGDRRGFIVDIETGVAEYGPELGRSAHFIDSDTLFVASDPIIYSKICQEKIENVDINIASIRHSPQQLATGDIFVGDREKTPVLDNKNCIIIGRFCGMLENGTIVSETDNELRFYA